MAVKAGRRGLRPFLAATATLAVFLALSPTPAAALEAIPFCRPFDVTSVHTLYEDERMDITDREMLARMMSCLTNRNFLSLATDLTITGIIRKLDPLYVGYVEFNVFERDLGLNVSGSLRRFNIENFSKLYVRNVAVDWWNMRADMMLQFERVYATSLYNVSGRMSDENSTADIFGNGDFKANFSNVLVNASLYFSLHNMVPQMRSFDYDYAVGNLHTDISGIFEDSFLSMFVNSLVNDVGTRFLNDRKPLIKRLLGDQVNSLISYLIVSQIPIPGSQHLHRGARFAEPHQPPPPLAARDRFSAAQSADSASASTSRPAKSNRRRGRFPTTNSISGTSTKRCDV